MTSDALRASMISESRIAPVKTRVPRSGRLRIVERARVPRDEIVQIAQDAILPSMTTDLCIVVESTPGEKLPDGSWSGRGGHTQYGPAWITEGRIKSEPIALFDDMKDAFELFQMLVGEEGELWQRKQRRLDAIAMAAAAEAAAMSLTPESGEPKPKRMNIHRKKSGGVGSPPPLTSSEKRSASPGREMSRRDRLRLASKTTSSRPPSS